MYKVGLCGNYGESDGDYNGQTVKTRTITKGLSKFLEMTKWRGSIQMNGKNTNCYY